MMPNSSLGPAVEDGVRNYYAMLYSLLILAIVFGNVLVCLAVVREKSLQTTTNYLVVSLAVADLLVASLVMPWAVYLEVSTKRPKANLFCTVAILTLTRIKWLLKVSESERGLRTVVSPSLHLAGNLRQKAKSEI